MKCPKCESQNKQNKIGKTVVGSQRYKCFICGYSYTPQKKLRGYKINTREDAISLYLTGLSLREIAKILGVHHKTVSN